MGRRVVGAQDAVIDGGEAGRQRQKRQGPGSSAFRRQACRGLARVRGVPRWHPARSVMQSGIGCMDGRGHRLHLLALSCRMFVLGAGRWTRLLHYRHALLSHSLFAVSICVSASDSIPCALHLVSSRVRSCRCLQRILSAWKRYMRRRMRHHQYWAGQSFTPGLRRGETASVIRESACDVESACDRKRGHILGHNPRAQPECASTQADKRMLLMPRQPNRYSSSQPNPVEPTPG